MAKRVRITSEEGPFAHSRVASRLQDAADRFEVSAIAVAAYIWPHVDAEKAGRFSWYKKVEERGSKFTVDEIDRAAAFFRERHHAPSLWPYADWDVAEAFDSFRALFDKARTERK